jgi:alpha-1,2-mannosyltransferase
MCFQVGKARNYAEMDGISQTEASLDHPKRGRNGLVLAIAILSLLPGLTEAYAVLWGVRQGYTGKALRDGVDFWAGGFLALHHQVAMVFDPVAYQSFVHGVFGLAGVGAATSAVAKLPPHMWSYAPNYLLITTAFDWLSPWHAVLAFDAASSLLLIFLLRLARLPWLLILAVAASPVSLENILEGQNAALMTALIGGGVLLLSRYPRLGGVLIGLATIKPQLGLTLPLFLLRRSAVGFAYAALVAMMLGAASVVAFGPGAWSAFWHVTRPAMSNVLLTGQPPEFANGLISVFAATRWLGVHVALVIQAVVSIGAILLAARTKNQVAVLILAALASPYLHDYDLLGVALAVALLVQDRLLHGFAAGEAILFFVAWAGPGAMPWIPQMAHATPVVLLLLLARAARRDRVIPCESARTAFEYPGSSAGP